MENIKLSPSMALKLKTRNNVNRIRHSSPKLQEVLREVNLILFLKLFLEFPIFEI